MGSRKRTDTDKEASEPAWRRTVLLAPRLDARAALAVAIAVVGAGLSAYLFRNSVADSYFAVKKDVVTAVGLGVVPIGLWLAVLSWALLARRSWLRYVNLWVSSLALVFVVLGAFAFFEPYRGGLAEFTLDGEVSLGGEVGAGVIGSTAWLGGMRLAGIFLAGVALGAPPLARDAAVAVGGLAVYGYVAAFVSLRSLVGSARMKSMPSLRRRPLWPRRREIEPDTELEPSPPSESELAPATGRVSIEERLNLSPAVPIRTDQHPMVPAPPEAEEEDELDPSPGETDEAELFEAEPELELEPEEKDTPAGTPAGKFNKLWGPPATQSEDSPDEDEQPQAAGRAVEWTRPSTDLLVEAEAGDITEEDMRTTADKIKRTLAEYGVEVEIGQIKPGPTVTMYGLIPGWVRRYKQEKQTDESGRPRLDQLGKPVTARVESKTRVKVDSILSREKDLALALRTPSIRIETPVMGKSLVGIEVPNPNPTLVTLRSVMEGPEFERLRERGHLPVALGRGSGGETVVTDLVKMPHLLIAGATGSGKSACINAIISCLIMEKTPAELRLLLIDPKRVELTPYNGIPHLLSPVVVETDQVVAFLKGMIGEMLDRYRRMEEVGVRNIEGYNKRVADKMPFLVVAIDELADLMMSASFDVEQSLCRLAQLGRATGIHLIVATQRPSVDVVTGLIKANFPSRISFGVTSHIDSRTILDSTGAEKLLGRGDMLYMPLDASRPMRAQGVFISDQEIQDVVKFWQTTPWPAMSRVRLRAVESRQDGGDGRDTRDDSRDELLEKAIELGKSYSKLSTSLLQRRLRIGYPRAARLMDQLEEEGFVGPSDGSKSRDVIISGT